MNSRTQSLNQIFEALKLFTNDDESDLKVALSRSHSRKPNGAGVAKSDRPNQTERAIRMWRESSSVT